MIKGRGGGYGFQVDDLHRLHRFLILGHEGGTYYAGQRELSLETVDCIDRLLDFEPEVIVPTIVEISQAGRAPKNDPAIFALAYVASKVGHPASFEALEALPQVCRIGTHLFDFLNNTKTLGRGWGNAFCRAVAQWYDRKPLSLAQQVTKYRQRNGWSHRDVLRKCHFATDNADLNGVLEYVTQHERWQGKARKWTDACEFLSAVDEAQRPDVTDKRRIELIREYGLVREHMPTDSLNNLGIWEALLAKMPLTAMIRNLGKMSSIGLVKPLSAASHRVVAALTNYDALKAQRVHPVALLIAQRTYARGCGLKGNLSWTPDQQVLSALDNAFYLAFDAVEPTGKRFLLGVDVSGSMGGYRCVGCELLSAREGATVMAMLAARTEEQTFIHGFSHQFVDLGISATDSFDSAIRKVSRLPFGATNCGLPFKFASLNNLEVDVFCIYTDNETNQGRHPYQELNRYRQKSGIPAKLAVFGLANTNFSIADPSDAGMMDFVGFDAAAPTLLADFALL